MREKEGNLSAVFVRELPELVVSSPEYRFRIPEGGTETASLRIRAEDGSRVEGLITSDCHRILLAAREFAGHNNEILFGIDTKGLSDGDRVEGCITVSCSLGERNIPVAVEVIEDAVELQEPAVSTLEDFAQLCQKSMREGFRLFTSPSFATIFDGKNRPYLALYRGMSHNPITYQHLEEFLVSTGRKEPITLSLDKQEKAVYHLDVSQKDTLYVYRSTWGYVRLEIETEGDFLEVEKKVVTSDDFIGRVYGLEYLVRSERLTEGKNIGRIHIRSVHQDLTLEVEAARGEEQPIRTSTIRKRRLCWLLRDQLALLLHELDYRSWHEKTQNIISEMRDDDPEDVTALLYAAHLAYTEDDNAHAMELLWPVKAGQLSPQTCEERAAYLYLAKSVDLLPQEKSDIRAELRALHRQEPASYLILALLQREEDPALELPLQRMGELEQCYDAGSSSPFLFLEAWELLCKEESLLRRLTPFLVQTLRFAQKHGLLTESMLLRAAYLSTASKTWSLPVYRLLESGYEKYPQTDILEAICKLIIRGEPGRPEYFRWYRAAVKEELRITRLYEYYMETFPGTCRDLLPLPVRMYFVYNNTLGEKKKALLYASVILHREEDPTSYTNYAKTMQRFALEALRNGRIDENYAVIYQHILAVPESRLAAEELCRVLFARRLTCDDDRMRRVVVCHNAFAKEQTYYLQGGTAFPNIYSEDACILLEDDKQRRYATTVDFKIEPLIVDREIAWSCMDQRLDSAGLELFLCHEKAYQMDINSRTLPVYRMAAENDGFTEEYRDIIRRKLMEHYLKNPGEETLTDFLDQMDPLLWARAGKADAATLLIREGRYDDAFAVVSEYGYEDIQPELLLRLASRLILKKEFAEDEELLCLTEHVFAQGKYDELMLSYLRDNMDGSVDRLCELWERLVGFQLDREDLDEKILRQAMFTHSFPAKEEKLLEEHIRRSGCDAVTKSYLVYVSEHFFLNGRKTDDGIFRLIEKLLLHGEELSPVCKLALLKRYSAGFGRAAASDRRDPAESEARDGLIRRLLREMNERGCRFEFFGRLPARFTQAGQLEDRVFVEEKFRPDSRVVLHYQLQGNGRAEGEWVSEPMRNVFGGIFVKEFLLFYGETLTYYMSVMEDGAIRKTDTFQLSLVDMDTFGSTRYKLLNRMLEARGTGDAEAAQAALDRYLEQENFAENLLQLL